MIPGPRVNIKELGGCSWVCENMTNDDRGQLEIVRPGQNPCPHASPVLLNM